MKTLLFGKIVIPVLALGAFQCYLRAHNFHLQFRSLLCPKFGHKKKDLFPSPYHYIMAESPLSTGIFDIAASHGLFRQFFLSRNPFGNIDRFFILHLPFRCAIVSFKIYASLKEESIL
jgi:hypothetical protein